MKEKRLNKVETFFARLFWRKPWMRFFLITALVFLMSILFAFVLTVPVSFGCFFLEISLFFLFLFIYGLLLFSLLLLFSSFGDFYLLPEYKKEKVLKRADKALDSMKENSDQRARKELLRLVNPVETRSVEDYVALDEWLDGYAEIVRAEKEITELRDEPKNIEKRIKDLRDIVVKRRKELEI